VSDPSRVEAVEREPCDNEAFLVEEYRVKWEYLRHLEQARDSLVKWYATLVGSLAALSLGVESAGLKLDGLQPLRPAVLAFCVVYSMFVALYLLVQKRNYRFYHERVEQIEDRLFGQKREKVRSRLLSSFRVYFAFPAAIGAGLLGILVFTVREDAVWALVGAVGYFLSAMATTWAKTFK